jgi:hypothetical protein
LTYTPNPNYCNDPSGSPDTFTYTLTPGASSATVSMTVTCVNDAPTDAGESQTATGNTRLEVELAVGSSNPTRTSGTGNLLDNASDVDDVASALSVDVATVSNPPHGDVSVNSDGSYVYTPDPGYTGADSFTYQVQDDDGAHSATQSVSITVATRIWYVRADAAPGGDGRSETPFDTLTAVDTAADATGDTIYVFRRSGDAGTVSDSSLDLMASQRLIGSKVDLLDGATLLYAGTPSLTPSLTGTSVKLDDANVVRGLDIAGSAAPAIDGGAGDTDGTIDQLTLSGAGGGLNLNGTSGTFNVSDLVVDTTGGTGVSLTSAGTVAFAPSSQISITTASGPALVASGTGLGTSVFDLVKVTSSAAGGVSLTSTTGTTTFGDGTGTDLDITTSGGTGFLASSAGTISVPDDNVTPTARIASTNGPGLDVSGSTVSELSFADVDSSGSGSDGINLAGLGTGTFTAGTGSVVSLGAGGAGVGFDLDGGSGAITYGGTITTSSTDRSVRVANRTGGTVHLDGLVTDNGAGVSLTSNGAGTVRFDGGLAASTGASGAFSATGSGTVLVTDPNAVGTAPDNTLTTTTGTALNVNAVTIGSDGLNFRSISSNGATDGIVLVNTGASGRLIVTGNGGTCTNADTSGCSGGTIQNGIGADDSGTTPGGTGIVLNSTLNPSFTRMFIHDHSNYAIRGTSVAGVTLADSVINGTNGTNATTPFDDSSVWFDNLTGSAAVTNTHVSGGYEDNFRVVNTSGSLNRITFTSVTIGDNNAADGNDGILLETAATAGQLQATITSSTFTGARGDLLQFNHNGSGAGDLVLTGNAFSNNHAGIATGGGGVSLFQGGTAGGNTTMTISGNSFRDAVGPGVLIVKSVGPATQTGTFTNNTIGVAAATNSGSAEGSALKLQLVDQGSSSWTVTNNVIRGYNNFGIEVLAGGGGSAQSGTFNTTITGNTITQPGDTVGTLTVVKQGIHFNIGTATGDTFQACAVIGGAGALANDIDTSGADAVPPLLFNYDVRLRQRMATTIRLPGYAGAKDDNAAVASFVNTNNSAGTTTTASNTVGSGGGGFTGSGTSCP